MDLGRHEEAEIIYRDLLDGWPGDEIRCRLAVLLLGLNQKPEALKLCEQIKSHSKRGNSHYRQVNREWIRWAMHILKTEGNLGIHDCSATARTVRPRDRGRAMSNKGGRAFQPCLLARKFPPLKPSAQNPPDNSRVSKASRPRDCR